MLPDIDGIEVSKKIREFSFCSILFLSVRNDDIDKTLVSPAAETIILLNFLVRSEIIYRIKSQIRRQQYQSVNTA